MRFVSIVSIGENASGMLTICRKSGGIGSAVLALLRLLAGNIHNPSDPAAVRSSDVSISIMLMNPLACYDL